MNSDETGKQKGYIKVFALEVLLLMDKFDYKEQSNRT